MSAAAHVVFLAALTAICGCSNINTTISLTITRTVPVSAPTQLHLPLPQSRAEGAH